MSPRQIARQFQNQATEARQRQKAIGKASATKQATQRAKAAAASFKPKKSDAGKLVFISSGGKRNPHHHGKNKGKGSNKGKAYDRKGYLIYVTKTGRKQLIKQNRYGYKATSFANVQPPLAPKYSASRQKIYAARSGRNQAGKVIVLGRGVIVPKSLRSGFTDSVIENFSDILETQLAKTAGQKRFNIKVMMKLKGIDNPVVALIPIDKPDNVAIEQGGIRNFVKKKLYAHLSSDLAAAGYVTSGSANHIRSLPWNEGKDKEEWEARPGIQWDRADKDIVNVEVFEWILEKNKFTKAKG